ISVDIPTDEVVIVAYDLPVAEAAVLLASGKIKGLVTDFGSKTSHTAILARALEVPCVVGAGQARQNCSARDLIASDGTPGEELPSEEEHYRAYSGILQRMQNRPVTIRTLDLGGDKLPIGQRSHEPNPALGLRAIRFTLRHPQLFRTQVRALLRASMQGKLQIMLPMVAAVDELRDAKTQIEAIRQELLLEGKP